jgi:transcriptional regulator with XRE-family HTH domain
LPSLFLYVKSPIISITFLSNIERGNNYPQAGTICSLADALGVNVWEIFKGERVSDDQNAIIERISKDYKANVIRALDSVYDQYKN